MLGFITCRNCGKLVKGELQNTRVFAEANDVKLDYKAVCPSCGWEYTWTAGCQFLGDMNRRFKPKK